MKGCPEIVTRDLGRFGYREREMAEVLLKAWNEQGLPADFEDDGVEVVMNTNSGYVFLTNAEFQVAMLNDELLESFYCCPECGDEGFKEDLTCECHQKALGWVGG